MNNEVLVRQFSRMGARLRIGSPTHWQIQRGARAERSVVRVDVLRDSEGEYFDLRIDPNLSAEVIDVQPRDRHLVLMVRDGRDKNKFLCGHDERHWFTAAVPGDSVRSVLTAKEALRPAGVNRNFIRQGEWFFVPAPGVQDGLIHRNEPLSRGAGSKPHLCEEIMRSGGIVVYINRDHPTGITVDVYNRLLGDAIKNGKQNEFRMAGWQTMTRDAKVYARGYVRHSDHKTIYLDGWCEVFMNNERFARHAVQVAFLD